MFYLVWQLWLEVVNVDQITDFVLHEPYIVLNEDFYKLKKM